MVKIGKKSVHPLLPVGLCVVCKEPLESHTPKTIIQCVKDHLGITQTEAVEFLNLTYPTQLAREDAGVFSAEYEVNGLRMFYSGKPNDLVGAKAFAYLKSLEEEQEKDE